MVKSQLTIATRESPLALWQANWVKSQLEQNHPGIKIQLLGMTTQADRMPYISLAEAGGKGLFVKELEEALLASRADIAVHSMKDMSVDLPPSLCLPVMCERELPWDAFVSNAYSSLEALPEGAVVGTASARRQSQLLALRPDLKIERLRGNVNTRLAKLDAGQYSAIILAAAGLKRLNLAGRIRKLFTKEQLLPAVGQGVLGIECRENDSVTQNLIACLNDEEAYACVAAERVMSKELAGGCQLPIAAYAEYIDGKFKLHGLVASLDGKNIVSAQAEGEDYFSVGKAVAKALLMQGADRILADIRSSQVKPL